jgi:signal transduction histidine kinase
MAVLDAVPAGNSSAAVRATEGANAPPRRRKFGLGLGAQVAFWTALITTVAVATTAAYLYQGNVAIVIERQKQQLAAATSIAVARAETRFDSAQRDVLFVARTPAMNTLAAALTAPPVGGADPAPAIDAAASLFAALLDARQNYLDVEFLGIDGREMVRVDRAAGKNRRTASVDLQDLSLRSYFTNAVKLPAGGVFVSDIELSRDTGAPAPRIPTSHVATPVYDQLGVLAGVVVVNIDLKQMFDLVDQSLGSDSLHYIVNQQGDYLLNPDAEKEFGFQRARQFHLQDDYPELAPLLQAEKESQSLDFTRSGGKYLAVGQHISMDYRDRGRFLAVVAVMSNDVLLERMRALRNRTIVFAGIAILIAVICAAFLARFIVRPIQSLTTAATAIGSGRRDIALDAVIRRQDETGQLARTITLMRDEISLREDRLAQQAAELTRSNQDLAQFAYVASHDLQEPLRMVSSYLELLSRRYGDKLDPDAHEFIGFAVDGAARMKRLINDLLGYSRIGHSPLRLQVVQASDIVATVLSQLGPAIRDVGANVQVGPLPKVRVDAAQMARVFQNLVENAIKYRRAGVVPSLQISARLESTGWWRFAVADNGIGIDPMFREKIFEIFKRLHGRDRYSGTGIGLSVAKLVVERHGGKIWVEAAQNGGSVFYFTVPESSDGGLGAAANRNSAG